MSDRVSKKQIDLLRERWNKQKPRIEAILQDVSAGEDWTRHLKASPANPWIDLPLVETCPTRTLPGEVARRDLRGLKLKNVDLYGAQGLANSCMDYCELDGVLLDSASLNGVSMRHATVSADCVLDRAQMQYSDLSCASFRGVSLEGADLTSAKICGTDFEDAILVDTVLQDVDFKPEDWWPFHLRRTWTRFGGRFQTPSQLGAKTDPLVASYIGGENLRWFVRKQNPVLAFTWYLFSDYGRSPLRLLLFTLLIWFAFGSLYAGYPLPSRLEGTRLGSALQFVGPQINWTFNGRTTRCTDPYYCSAVIMLGLSDMIGDLQAGKKAQIYACVQAILGYLFLAVFVVLLLQYIRPVHLPPARKQPDSAAGNSS
jgi:hypothetical protein